MIGTISTNLGLVIRMRAECLELVKKDIARYGSIDEYVMQMIIGTRNINLCRASSLTAVREKVKSQLSVNQNSTDKVVELVLNPRKAETYTALKLECIRQQMGTLEYLERAVYIQTKVA
jgi:hypothetical protein